jgi:hypothetical protein
MFEIYLAILGLFALSSLKPDFVKAVGIKIVYNTIYFYSACQIKCTQAYNYLIPYFKNNENINQIKIDLFDINTNKLINILEKDLQDIVKDNLYIATIDNINNVNKNKSSITNKLIIDKNSVCLAFDVSNITFIALYLNYNDMLYNINLKTDEFNYYLVGNIIDKYFVQYYINTVLNLNFSYKELEIKTYQLELVDHNVNIINLNFEQSIIIEKDGYRIVNNLQDVVEVEVEVEDKVEEVEEEKSN